MELRSVVSVWPLALSPSREAAKGGAAPVDAEEGRLWRVLGLRKLRLDVEAPLALETRWVV